jgi:glycosyltransferase involved in cell wall biosynthesis
LTKKPAIKPCGVLMLIENNAYPWDRRMFHHATTLQTAGYRVTVICPKGELASKSPWIEVLDGVKVYRYPHFFQASTKFGYPFEYLWSLLCMTVLSIIVWVREGFQIIHAANPPDLLFLLAWPYKLLGKSFVYDEHDICPELYESKFQKRGWFYHLLLLLENGSYHAADLVISTNQSYRDIALERGGIEDERSAIVRNGVDLAEFHRRVPRSELKQNFPYMATYLGIMGKQDGVDRIVQAARHLLYDQGRQDVLFVMIGKGECWRDLQDLSRELKVDHIMHFTGRISDDLLLDYLSTADVCLAPDPPDKMNILSTMTKIMEYMACERPIVSFDLLETRRSAGEAAVYVSPEDPKLFAQALSELLDDPIRRDLMGQIGLDRSIHLVGLDKSQQALLEAYSRFRGTRRVRVCVAAS